MARPPVAKAAAAISVLRVVLAFISGLLGVDP
jgi:hypothetical protein